MAVDERALVFLRELGHADEEAAATLAELDELAADADRIRVRSRELQSRSAQLPAEQERLRSAHAEANRKVEDSRRELSRAEAAVDAARAAGDDRAETSVRHAVVRHGDAVTIAERRARQAELELAQAEHDAEKVTSEGADVTKAAERLAASLRDRPRLAEQAGAAPARDLTGISEWASGVRAALFVARAALVRERDGLIRQANELGTVLLGEPIVSGAASDVARRVARSV